MIIYILTYINIKKKIVVIIATVPLGIVVTVKKKKKWLTKPISKMKVFLLSPNKAMISPNNNKTMMR